jgi:hypothetical protein
MDVTGAKIIARRPKKVRDARRSIAPGLDDPNGYAAKAKAFNYRGSNLADSEPHLLVRQRGLSDRT